MEATIKLCSLCKFFIFLFALEEKPTFALTKSLKCSSDVTKTGSQSRESH